MNGISFELATREGHERRPGRRRHRCAGERRGDGDRRQRHARGRRLDRRCASQPSPVYYPAAIPRSLARLGRDADPGRLAGRVGRCDVVFRSADRLPRRSSLATGRPAPGIPSSSTRPMGSNVAVPRGSATTTPSSTTTSPAPAWSAIRDARFTVRPKTSPSRTMTRTRGDPGMGRRQSASAIAGNEVQRRPQRRCRVREAAGARHRRAA